MSHSVPTEKTNIPSSAAFWAVLIFIGLILAAVNFVKAESAGEGHGEHGEAKTEHVEGGEHATEAHEATTEAAKPATEATTEAAATHASTDTTKAATTEEAHH